MNEKCFKVNRGAEVSNSLRYKILQREICHVCFAILFFSLHPAADQYV